METIKPDFKQEPLDKSMIPMMFMADDPTADYSDDPTHFDIESSDAMLIHYDSINDKLSGHFYRFDGIVVRVLFPMSVLSVTPDSSLVGLSFL